MHALAWNWLTPADQLEQPSTACFWTDRFGTAHAAARQFRLVMRTCTTGVKIFRCCWQRKQSQRVGKRSLLH
jgi:hypothetical protein